MSHPLTRPRRLAGPIAAVALAALIAVPSASAAVYRLGARGSAVKQLNARLAALSYLPARPAGRRFTAATEQGVIAFQKYADIGADGIVGPQTQAALKLAARPQAPAGAGRRIVVSLSRQLAFLVNARDLVVRTVSVSTGRPGYATPPGVFRIYRRERDSWSNPYQVSLPWAAYFYRGYAFHGWASVPVTPASHGCVRVPLPFAAEVFRYARLGTEVDIG